MGVLMTPSLFTSSLCLSDLSRLSIRAALFISSLYRSGLFTSSLYLSCRLISALLYGSRFYSSLTYTWAGGADVSTYLAIMRACLSVSSISLDEIGRGVRLIIIFLGYLRGSSLFFSSSFLPSTCSLEPPTPPVILRVIVIPLPDLDSTVGSGLDEDLRYNSDIFFLSGLANNNTFHLTIRMEVSLGNESSWRRRLSRFCSILPHWCFTIWNKESSPTLILLRLHNGSSTYYKSRLACSSILRSGLFHFVYNSNEIVYL